MIIDNFHNFRVFRDFYWEKFVDLFIDLIIKT